MRVLHALAWVMALCITAAVLAGCTATPHAYRAALEPTPRVAPAPPPVTTPPAQLTTVSEKKTAPIPVPAVRRSASRTGDPTSSQPSAAEIAREKKAMRDAAIRRLRGEVRLGDDPLGIRW